jgi:lipopolysaccharide transport system ATP-binding protein
MYVRLAFSVAAHLEPEILVVDEVLAVGDAEFQKKCLGKMQDVASSGRTVLFVSHNIAAMKSLCSKAIYLSSGKVELFSDINSTLTAYLTSNQTKEAIWTRSDSTFDNPHFSPTSIRYTDGIVYISGTIQEWKSNLSVGIEVFAPDGTPLYSTTFRDSSDYEEQELTGPVSWRVPFPRHLLNSGTYTLKLQAFVYNFGKLIDEQAAPEIYVTVNSTGRGAAITNGRRGHLLPVLNWALVDDDPGGSIARVEERKLASERAS